MNIKTLNVSLLSISIITALFPLNAMATKLTIEQRLSILMAKMFIVMKVALIVILTVFAP